MYKYALTEAYSEIYDPRKIEESFDNLRFVDYMLSEDIEEVIEELVWEFRDYGHTLEESFEMIDYALEDEVICESYDQLVADVLYEANPYAPAGSPEARAYQQYTTANKRETKRREIERRAKRIGEIRNAKRSVKSRMSKLSGPISSVKQSLSGATGGMGRAVKAAGGAVVKRGQALLKGLLRRGGEAMKKTGKRMMASGTRAAAAPATTRTARVGGRQVTVTTEPTAETGSKRRAVGSAIRKIGKSLKRMGKVEEKPARMTLSDYQQRKAERTAAAKKEVGDAFATSKEPAKSERRYPVEPSGQTSLFTGKGPKGKTAGPEVKVPLGGQKRFGKTVKPKSKEKTRQMTLRLRESDYKLIMKNIAEDLIEAGYTSNLNESYDLIDQMDESTLYDIIQEYLD